MPIYKGYIIESDDRFRNAIDLDLAHDASAIESAKRLVTNGYDVELWEGNHKIATFKAASSRRLAPFENARVPFDQPHG
jgi:hypothetical protein